MRLYHHAVNGPESAGRQLLMVCHGLGDSWEGWTWLPGELGLPAWDVWLINAPLRYWEGWAWFGIDPADFQQPRTRLPRIDPGELQRSRVALQDKIQEALDAGYAADHVALLGFSQGCVMALDAGLRFPHRLSAIVGISGWIHEPGQLVQEAGSQARQIPILMTHGPRDPIVPMAPVRDQARVLQQAGFDLAWQEFEKEHTVAGRAEVQFIRRFLAASVDGTLSGG